MPSSLGPSARRGIVDAAPRRPEGDNSKSQRTPQPVDARWGCQTEPKAQATGRHWLLDRRHQTHAAPASSQLALEK